MTRTTPGGRDGKEPPLTPSPTPGATFEPDGVPEHDFTIIANEVLRTTDLSFAAKGLLVNMVSHRADYPITVELLARQSKDGKSAINSAMAELIQAGYVTQGARTRYPAGTRNQAGKDISGALGPYRFYFTTRVRKAEARRAETPAQHYGGKPAVVLTRDDAGRFARGTTAGNRRQSPPAKTTETAGHHYSGITTVVNRRSIEDQVRRPKEEDQPASADAARSDHDHDLFGNEVRAEPVTPARPDPAARFDEFWAEVVKKHDKKDAQKLWVQYVKAGVDPDTMIEGMRRYNAMCRAEERKRPQYKGPAVWLRAENWRDEYPPDTSSGGQRAGQAPQKPTDPWPQGTYNNEAAQDVIALFRKTNPHPG